jgi:hypothetical protein
MVRIAFGLRAHSGWAALVALGEVDGRLEVLDRRRLELVPEEEADWANQPYHAAEGLSPRDGRAMVRRGFDLARRNALRELRAAVKRVQEAGREGVACAVLMGEAMPAWSLEEILAVHFRMHKAEGVLFRDVLVRAAAACGLEIVPVPEKQLSHFAERALRTPAAVLAERVSVLGKSVGPPWGKDQKNAALAAMIALRAQAP